MRVTCKIHSDANFSDDSYIGSVMLDSIPTTSTPRQFDENNQYRLTNLIAVEAQKIEFAEYNGEYFVVQSLFSIDNLSININQFNFPIIELILEKHSSPSSPNLYLTGALAYYVTENLINIKFTGAVKKDLKYIIVPRASLDFLLFDGNVYDCDKVLYKSNGDVEIQTKHKKTLEQFRNGGSL